MRFVDHYETLQLSPNASADLVERVYRILAKRYHPDNQETGNADRFGEILEAYQVLSDPEKRAAYDASYEGKRKEQWDIVRQAVSDDVRNDDRQILDGILSLLYVARRRDPHGGGLGAVNLERMLGHPQEHLAFPMWYLKQHGYIETLDNGQYAITVSGIDSLNGKELRLPTNRLLPESSMAGNTSSSHPQGRIPQEVG